MSLSGTDEVNNPIEEKNAAEENDLNQPQRRGKIIREAMRDVLISVILLVLTTLVTYGDFEKSPASSILASGPRTRASPQPRPLFGGENSYIDDYYTGDIFAVFEEADNFENAFIMFYAPWDADCIRSAKIIEAIAKVFIDSDIYFAAINCWEPKGHCHNEFSGTKGKAAKNPRLVQHQYPIFIFYPKDRRGIQYNGPISVQSILEFLLLARKPATHLGSKSDLVSLRANHGGQALVGYFPDLMHSRRSYSALKKFLDATYHFLEHDPFQNKLGGIGIVTSPQVAFQLQLDTSRPLRYFHWNGSSVAYPNKTISTTQSLVTWTQNQLSNTFVTWIGTSGRKSLNLSNRLESNSRYSLLVFLERKPRRLYNEALRIVNSVALQYFTCDENVSGLGGRGLNGDASNLLKAMQDQERLSFVRQDSFLSQCSEDPWFVEHFTQDVRPMKKNITTSSGGGSGSGINGATPAADSFRGKKELLLRLPHKLRPEKPLVDSKVLELKRMAQRLDCSLMASTASAAASIGDQSDSYDDSEVEDNCDLKEVNVFDEHEPFVWGLGCRDNRSLNFYVLDFVTQWSLVQKLDLDSLDKGRNGSSGPGHHKVLPKAVIISLNDDKIFAMDQELSSPNLENFVRTFHGDSREQPKVESEAEAGTATGAATEATRGSLRQLKLSKAISEQQKAEAANAKTSMTSIEEIHAGNFAERLMRSPRSVPVVVLYTGESCAFCQVASHVFQTLKGLISSDLVEFVSVDASANDLPWAFTALAVPSVLYFHPNSGSSTSSKPKAQQDQAGATASIFAEAGETRAFPMSKRLSVPNLLSFIVANLDGETRVRLALSICGDDCLQEARVEAAKKPEIPHDYFDRLLAMDKLHEEL